MGKQFVLYCIIPIAHTLCSHLFVRTFIVLMHYPDPSLTQSASQPLNHVLTLKQSFMRTNQNALTSQKCPHLASKNENSGTQYAASAHTHTHTFYGNECGWN